MKSIHKRSYPQSPSPHSSLRSKQYLPSSSSSSSSSSSFSSSSHHFPPLTSRRIGRTGSTRSSPSSSASLPSSSPPISVSSSIISSSISSSRLSTERNIIRGGGRGGISAVRRGRKKLTPIKGRLMNNDNIVDHRNTKNEIKPDYVSVFQRELIEKNDDDRNNNNNDNDNNISTNSLVSNATPSSSVPLIDPSPLSASHPLIRYPPPARPIRSINIPSIIRLINPSTSLGPQGELIFNNNNSNNNNNNGNNDDNNNHKDNNISAVYNPMDPLVVTVELGERVTTDNNADIRNYHYNSPYAGDCILIHHKSTNGEGIIVASPSTPITIPLSPSRSSSLLFYSIPLSSFGANHYNIRSNIDYFNQCFWTKIDIQLEMMKWNPLSMMIINKQLDDFFHHHPMLTNCSTNFPTELINIISEYNMLSCSHQYGTTESFGDCWGGGSGSSQVRYDIYCILCDEKINERWEYND